MYIFVCCLDDWNAYITDVPLMMEMADNLYYSSFCYILSWISVEYNCYNNPIMSTYETATLMYSDFSFGMTNLVWHDQLISAYLA